MYRLTHLACKVQVAVLSDLGLSGIDHLYSRASACSALAQSSTPVSRAWLTVKQAQKMTRQLLKTHTALEFTANIRLVQL
jgi:hypothetical protein